MASDRGILLAHRNSVKQFYFSKNTQTHLINALIKRAFHLSTDVKSLRHPRGYVIAVGDVFNFNLNQPFELFLEDDNSDNKSETLSQKALTKRSGRKYPAQEKEIHDTKFYIDDFQFFMQEVSSRNEPISLGIVFFNDKKSANYLGKKILRELIYEFDQLQFFYALHPLKRHSNSVILGDTLVFTLFHGTRMIHEREFPENLSAIMEISGYLKCLVRNGEIPESGPQPYSQPAEIHRNLIEVSEQRSFDMNAENGLRKDHFDEISKKQEKSYTVDKTDGKADRVSPVLKIESPLKSQLTNEMNEISFENDFYQPDWFTEGDRLSRLQKSFLSALIKSGDSPFASFCHSLDLKDSAKQSLMVELIKVYLNDIIEKKMSDFSREERYLIEFNQENRQSWVFSLLLKLNKFGNLDDFIANIKKNIHLLKTKKATYSYVELARDIEKKRNSGLIKLQDCRDQGMNQSADSTAKLAGKDPDLDQRNNKIADQFHRSSNIMILPDKHVSLPKQLSQGEQALIRQLIAEKDPFLVENYIDNKWLCRKKFQILPPALVRKYLQQNSHLYSKFREFAFEEKLKLKFKKLEHFSNLLYFLYKQRTINNKQNKGFFYLYIWSDLKVLGAFELYLLDRNIEDFIENLYFIDYTYYLQKKYEFSIQEIESFSWETRLQLVILFLLNGFIEQTDHKTLLEKFITMQDQTLLQAFIASRTQEQLVKKMGMIVQEQQEKLADMAKSANLHEQREKHKKEDMKKFIQQIKPAHFKSMNNEELVFECIEKNEPRIHAIFEVFYLTNEVVEWIDSFTLYLQNLDKIHMHTLLNDIASKYNLDTKRIQQCRAHLIHGVYEMLITFRDEDDAAETLSRILSKESSLIKQS